MKKILIIAVLNVFIAAQAWACLNGETKTLKDGTGYMYDPVEISNPINDYMKTPHGHKLVEFNYTKTFNNLDRLWKKTNDIAYLSDCGVVLILQKKYAEAVTLFLKIEQIKPNRYSTAANLGTAYELLGDNANALKWIKKAVQLDPKSHNESEWLHVQILEAKIQGKAAYTSDFLLSTNFGIDSFPTSKLPQAELVKLKTALFYQLQERITFIKSKDTIIARLLFELGNLNLLNKDTFPAKYCYQRAIDYGLQDSLYGARYYKATHFDGNTQQPTSKVKPVTNNNTWALVGGGGVAVALLILAIVRRRKQGEEDLSE